MAHEATGDQPTWPHSIVLSILKIRDFVEPFLIHCMSFAVEIDSTDGKGTVWMSERAWQLQRDLGERYANLGIEPDSEA